MDRELTPIAIDGRTAYKWICSVANALYWEDDSLWTGKDDAEYGDPEWMEWRSGMTVSTFMDRARTFVPADVYAAFEAWNGED